MIDLLVIGCGISGATIARHFAEKGKRVTIFEKRKHIGGNMYDYMDKHGILVHKYGPHIFHTNNKEIYEYMCAYAQWNKYNLTCMAEIDGKVTPTPFNFKTIDDFFSEDIAKELKYKIKKAFKNKKKATVLELLGHKDDMIKGYAQFLFDKDYSLYTAKQWGIPPEQIDPSILKRVPVKFSYDLGYFDDKYQMLPQETYTHFFYNLLNHKNISVLLNVNALEKIKVNENELLIDNNIIKFPVVYTGALDELFGCTEGKLPYRSLKFEWIYKEIDSFQKAPVVAYPQAEKYTRITEYKKLPPQKVFGTTFAVEYPMQYNSRECTEAYYPVLTTESILQYKKYQKRADTINNLYYCGRLADFKYYNMDQALERALSLCELIEKDICLTSG